MVYKRNLTALREVIILQNHLPKNAVTIKANILFKYCHIAL